MAKVNATPTKPPVENKVDPVEQLLTSTDILLMLYSKDKFGNFYYDITSEDERTVYDLVRMRSAVKTSLLIFLDSGGGNIYSAVKIMDVLRTKYKKISIAVAQEAKSSASMMCLGADEIIMCPISELGPLDKPMTHPNDETARISALDIVRSLDGMIDNAVERQKKLSKDLQNEYGISVSKSWAIASDSISKLMAPMLCNEDAKVYNKAKRLLAIAEVYGIEFLGKYMLSYIKDEKLREKIAKTLMKRFIWLYSDHIFAIRRDELNEWFLIVKKAEDYEWWSNLYKEFLNTVNRKGKIIKFL